MLRMSFLLLTHSAHSASEPTMRYLSQVVFTFTPSNSRQTYILLQPFHNSQRKMSTTNAPATGGLSQSLIDSMTEHLTLFCFDEHVYDFIVGLTGGLSINAVSSSTDELIATIPAHITNGQDHLGIAYALAYSESECGMPEDCLAAVEQYYKDAACEEYQYEGYVEAFALGFMVPWQATAAIENMSDMPLASLTAVLEDYQGLGAAMDAYHWHVECFENYGMAGYTHAYEWMVEQDAIHGNEYMWTPEYYYHLDADDGLSDIDLGPVFTDDMFYQSVRVQRIDPQEFVDRLDTVDVATIPAEDMKCFYCWNRFGETDDEVVELSTGEIQADNSPLRIPCAASHLVGKTCLMQLIDAGVHTCQLCREDIVALVG